MNNYSLKKPMIWLRKQWPLPIYYQLKEALREQIESGVLKPHERLPSERELEETYHISRMTARRALSELEVEGYVYRQQGRGSFVAEPKIRQGLLRLTSFTEDMHARGLVPGARVIDVEVLSGDEELARRLKAAPDEQFVKIQRVRLANGEPMSLETSFLRRKFCEGIEKIDFTDRSLYKMLRDRYGIYLSRAEQVLEVKLADEYEAEILGVKKGAPMWMMERLTYLEDERTAIEYVRSIYRGDRYKLYAELDTKRR
jgi:GntR family transcriptional regulator